MGYHEGELEVRSLSYLCSTLYERYSVNMVVLNRLVTLSLGKFSSKEKADDIAAFFKDKEVKGFDRGLNQVIFLPSGLMCRVSIW